MPIEKTANYIRIRVLTVKNVKRFRFKTLSEKKGIMALMAFVKGKGSQIVSYLFSKKKGWTVKKARAWVKSHGHSVAETKLVYGIKLYGDRIEFVEETVPEGVEEEENVHHMTKVEWLLDGLL